MVEASASFSSKAKKSKEPSVFLAWVTLLLETYGAKKESIADCGVSNNGIMTYLDGVVAADEDVVNDV